ncbi:hypothetical protein AB0I89_26685 [Micromonospora sp. NPDC049801]|uniref:hypothetical protein n=1 Tax=unclassified Micromonospora TaxID=2617518 RepID=UPI0033C7D07B
MDVGGEDEVKRLLGITDWRGLSKEKFRQFVAMMPDMDKETRIKLIEQLPEVMRFAAEVVAGMTKVHDATLAANEGSQARVQQTWDEIRATISAQLDRDDLDTDGRVALADRLILIGDRQAEADARNKTYLDRWDSKRTLGLLAAAVILTTLAAGGKTALQNGSLLRR